MKKYAVSFFLLFSFIFCSPVFGMNIFGDGPFHFDLFVPSYSDKDRISVSTDKKELIKECLARLSPFFGVVDRVVVYERIELKRKVKKRKVKKRKVKKIKLSEGSKNIMDLPYDCIGYLLLYLPQSIVIHKISLVNKAMNHYIKKRLDGYWSMKKIVVMTIRPSSFDNNDKLKSCFGFDSIYSHKDVKRIHLKIKCNEKSSDNQAEQNINGGSEIMSDWIDSLLSANDSLKKEKFSTQNSGFIKNLKKLVDLKKLADKVVCFSFYSFVFTERKTNFQDVEGGVVDLSTEDEKIIVLGKKYFKEFKNSKVIFVFDDRNLFNSDNLSRFYDLSDDHKVFSNLDYNDLKRIDNELINHDDKILNKDSECLNYLLETYKDKDPNIIYTSKMKST